MKPLNIGRIAGKFRAAADDSVQNRGWFPHIFVVVRDLD
jgi:hypothetical protein